MSAEKYFGQGGAVSRLLEGYVPRPGQAAMAQAVFQALKDRRHLLVEGPTGTGKSLAYSIPAALDAGERGKPTIICTANITLQEQLFFKDLPFVQRVIEDAAGVSISYALVKGMNNYLCLAKYNDAINDKDVTVPGYVQKWRDETETGDRSELEQEPDSLLWSSISSSSDECLRNSCEHFDSCYAFRARERAYKADVIVTNYHLLFADIEVTSNGGLGVLPDYNVLIMDEAHEAASIAMDFYGWKLNHSRISRLCKKALLMAAEGEKLANAAISASKSFFRGLNPDDRFVDRALPAGPVRARLGDLAEYYSKEAKNQPKESTSRARLQQLSRVCGKVRAQLKEVEEADRKEGVVYFVEKSNNPKMREPTELSCKAVETAPFFRNQVFSGRTVVAASATMTTGGNFRFIADQMGLARDRYSSVIAPSPFDTAQVLAVVPKQFPLPNSREHTIHVAKAIESISDELGGRVMGLFTSWRAMNAARDYLEDALRESSQVLYQGQLPKTKLIEKFKRDSRFSILLATASFWQGVDIPGKGLSCVIIDKIPFARPDDPVIHYLERKDGSSFFGYSVPQAVIRLKQGVGRLIRTESDYGVVAIMDPRIWTKGYGDTIMSAFPPGCFEGDDPKDIIQFIGELDERYSKEASTSGDGGA